MWNIAKRNNFNRLKHAGINHNIEEGYSEIWIRHEWVKRLNPVKVSLQQL